MNRRLGSWLMALVTILPLARPAAADDSPPPDPAPAQTPGPDAAQVRRALIVCGLPGDDEHRQLFAETIEKLYSALTERHGFGAKRIAVLFSEETDDKDGPALKSSRGPATREKLTETVAELERSIQLDDALWVFVFGHAHFDGRSSWLNLPGPDMNHAEFGKLFAGVRCREQAYFITTPASGYFIKPLAAAGRVVMVATEADFEVNETRFPHRLVELLADPPALAEFDIDGDGRATLLDAYLGAARATAQEYADGELLATEHALIDDNGDGRGTEVQLDYLPEELGGRRRLSRRKPTPSAGDGALARGMSLAVPLAAPAANPDSDAPDSDAEPTAAKDAENGEK